MQDQVLIVLQLFSAGIRWLVAISRIAFLVLLLESHCACTLAIANLPPCRFRGGYCIHPYLSSSLYLSLAMKLLNACLAAGSVLPAVIAAATSTSSGLVGKVETTQLPRVFSQCKDEGDFMLTFDE